MNGPNCSQMLSAKRQQGLGAGQLIDREVELIVEAHVAFGVAVRHGQVDALVDLPMLSISAEVMFGKARGRPSSGSRCRAREQDLLEFLARHCRYQDAAIVLHIERAFGDQPAYGLAHWHGADAQFVGQSAQSDRAAGFEAAEQDPIAQLLIDFLVGRRCQPSMVACRATRTALCAVNCLNAASSRKSNACERYFRQVR